MIKGAPVTPEASTISGASATTEVQNNSAEVQYNSASASDPVDPEAPAKILIPLEHCLQSSPNSEVLHQIAVCDAFAHEESHSESFRPSLRPSVVPVAMQANAEGEAFRPDSDMISATFLGVFGSPPD